MQRRWRGAGDSESAGGIRPHSAEFPQTSTSLLRGVASPDPEERRAALTELMKRYWKPLFHYLRALHFAEADSEDIVQSFFERALVSHLMAEADTSRGRFRNFLKTSVRNFAIDVWRRERAHDRRRPEDWEPEAPEITPDIEREAEEIFRTEWVKGVVRRVLHRLETEWAPRQKELHFNLFKKYLVDPILNGAPRPTYEELGAEYGLDGQKVANMVVTVKRAFRRYLAEEIKVYTFNLADARAEFAEAWNYALA